MARTKQTARKSLPGGPKDWKHIQTPAFPVKRGSEPMIHKYYPKISKIFWKGLLHKYQAPDADEVTNPNTSILLKYRRDFFNSFAANWNTKSLEPAKLPHNVKYLNIHNGSQILLRKLLKQNKRLKHIEVAMWSDKLFSVVLKSLRYCKNLCSINFSRSFHFISEKRLNSMKRSFGKTLQKVTILARIDAVYSQKPEELKRVMEGIFQFPKLRKVEFGTDIEAVSESFPVNTLQGLQDRNIACHLKFRFARNTPKAFLESFPEVKPNDYVRINMRDSGDFSRFGWDKKVFEKKRILNLSQQVRDLDISALEDFYLSTLLQRFREASNLELVLSTTKADKTDYSGLKQLSNLKRLNINIENTEDDESILGSFFLDLSDAVDAHKKLEELTLRVSCSGGRAIDHDESIILFFEDCAETLKKAHFEFRYSGENFKELEPFYQGIGKLENLQSFNILLSFSYFGFDEKIEELSEMMLKMKSLEEVNFGIEKHQYGEDPIHLIFPPWIKKLVLAMDQIDPPFDPATTLWSLPNLTWLRLEFLHFNSPEWSEVIQDIDKLEKLEVLVLKQSFAQKDVDFLPQMTRKLDGLMKQCLNLKLIVFGSRTTREVILFRRSGYSWQEVNSIVAEFSYLEHISVQNIYRYS